MRIRTEFTAVCSPAVAWRALHDPHVAAALYAPLLVMDPVTPMPERLVTGSYARVRLRAFGFVPVGTQEIRITDQAPDASESCPRTMRDHGRPLSGPLAALTHWQHEITISSSAYDPERAVWSDELRIGGAWARAFRLPLALMWRWRGHKLRRLARNWRG